MTADNYLWRTIIAVDCQPQDYGKTKAKEFKETKKEATKEKCCSSVRQQRRPWPIPLPLRYLEKLPQPVRADKKVEHTHTFTFQIT